MRNRMKKISSKKCFFYVSLMLLICYALFVLLAFNSDKFEVLYDVKTASSYYLFTYLILSAILYAIDSHTRKEPAFLSLFCLPIFTYVFLVLTLLSGGYTYEFYLIITVFISLIYVISFVIKKCLVSKILTKGDWYANILFVYVIVHLMIALYLSFRFLGYM